MIKYDLSKITTVIFDVDGVLSENTIPMDLNGNPIRTMNVKDGYAIQLAAKQGIRLAIITGGKCDSIQYRYSKLGVNDIFMGCAVKIEKYREYCRQNNLKDEEVMFLGDDIPDYEIMKVAGCTCCPSDACQEIKDISTYVSAHVSAPVAMHVLHTCLCMCLRARLHAAGGGNHDQRRIRDRQRRNHLADEIRIARRVDKIHLAAAPLDSRQRAGNTQLPLALLRLIVESRSPVVHLSEAARRARVEKRRVQNARLARPAMTDDGDIP